VSLLAWMSNCLRFKPINAREADRAFNRRVNPDWTLFLKEECHVLSDLIVSLDAEEACWEAPFSLSSRLQVKARSRNRRINEVEVDSSTRHDCGAN
jgi:hypothetical protein